MADLSYIAISAFVMSLDPHGVITIYIHGEALKRHHVFCWHLFNVFVPSQLTPPYQTIQADCLAHISELYVAVQ